ncbi:MAG: hypothetical protein P8Z72_16555, partial [Gammaproteobacteria bacterium]
RSWGGRLNKNHLAFRVFNFLTISFSLFLSGLLRFGRDDKVIVVTNPPLLPFLIIIAAKVKRNNPDREREKLIVKKLNTLNAR